MFNNTIIKPEIIAIKSNEYTQLYNGNDKSDILFQLQRAIKVNNNVNIYLNLGMFRFVNSFYNIPSSSNVLHYKMKLRATGIYGAIQTVTIPKGNYNSSTIFTQLNNYQNMLSFTFDTVTKKVLVDISIPSQYSEATLLPNENTILDHLGFSVTENTIIYDTLEAPNLINLLSTSNLYITIEDLNLSSNGCLGYTNTNLLEHIGVTALSGNSQTFQSLGMFLKCDVKQISQLRVKIYDGKNNLVQFENVDWYMTLYVTYQYDNEFKPPTFLDTEVNRLALEELINQLNNKEQQ